MTLAIVAALHRLTARWEHAPRIVTVSRRPNPALLPQIFGAHAVHNLVAGEDGIVLTSPDGEARFVDLAEAAAAIAAASGDGLILRFIDPATLRLVREAAPALIEVAAVVLLKYKDEAAQDHAATLMARAGFAHRLVSPQPPMLVLSRAPIGFDPAPDYAAAGRTRLNSLVLVDYNLSGERGHYLSVATRISQGALQAGAKVVWAAHERLDAALVPKGVDAMRVFPTSLFDLEKDAQASTDLSAEVLAGWRAAVAAHDAPTTHFLAPTTDGNIIRAADALLGEGVKGVVHLATPYETKGMAGRHAGRELDWHLRRIAGGPAFGRRAFLWSETATLGAAHAERLGRAVPPLPLPAPPWALDLPAPHDDGPFTIAFLGEARPEKGALDLPEIAAALRAADPDVRIVVQQGSVFGGMDEALAAAFAELSALPGVEIVPGAISDADYRALLARANAVLLPYRPDSYALRGSGVMIEALAAGRIILASEGTIVREFADEGVVHVCRGGADWTEALRRILADRAGQQLRAFRRGRRFAKRHAPRAYVDRLAVRAELALG